MVSERSCCRSGESGRLIIFCAPKGVKRFYEDSYSKSEGGVKPIIERLVILSYAEAAGLEPRLVSR